jgi:hypothetical protein
MSIAMGLIFVECSIRTRRGVGKPVGGVGLGDPFYSGSYRFPVVLVAFFLVLLAAASFAAGIAASRTSDTLVYVSIVFSLAAFVMLAAASVRARHSAGEEPDDEWTTSPMRTIEASEAHAGPLLGGLDPTQLDMTPTWRRQGRQRTQAAEPVAEEEELDEQLENEEDEADFEVPVEPVAPHEFRWGLDDDEDREPTVAFAALNDDDEFDEIDEVDEDRMLDVDEPEPEPEPERAGGVGPFFDEYDDLTAAEILPFLSALDLDGLQWVRQRERSGAKRATVVTLVEQLIAEHGGRTSAPRKRAAPKKAAPARRAKKTTTKKTTTKKSTTKKSTRRR